MTVTSKTLRSEIVESLVKFAGNNPDDYEAYMTACGVSWFFKDSPTGMSTINQLNRTLLVHTMISNLVSVVSEASPDLTSAHIKVHDLRDYLIQKLKDKGYISADDHGLDDDGLIDKHADDFDAWLAEIETSTGDETDK